jgi:MFS family permease
VKSVGSMWCFVVLFGYFGAGVQSLFPAALGSLTKDPTRLGTRIGMMFSIVSFACLSGPPIAGALIQKDGGNYYGAQIFGGVVMTLGALLVATSRTVKSGPKWHVWM